MAGYTLRPALLHRLPGARFAEPIATFGVIKKTTFLAGSVPSENLLIII